MSAHSLPSSELVTRYNRGESIHDIARKLHRSPMDLAVDLLQAGVKLGERKRKRAKPIRTKPILKLDVARLAQLYFDEKRSLDEVARACGCSFATVKARLKEAGYTLRPAGVKSRAGKPTRELAPQILELHAAGKRPKEIASEVGCSPTAVYTTLNKNGIWKTPEFHHGSAGDTARNSINPVLQPGYFASLPPAEGSAQPSEASSSDADQSPSLDVARGYPVLDPDDFGPMYVDARGFIKIDSCKFFVGVHRASSLIYGAISNGVLQLRTTLGFLTYSDRNGAHS